MINKHTNLAASTNLPAWHEEPIAKTHDRAQFDCGNKELNTFLREHARQNHEKGGGKTFLAIADDDRKMLGFYTLSPASVSFERTPQIIKHGLPRHDIPAFRLARLAVDRSMQRKGLEGQLLLAAGRRCLAVVEHVGGLALIIDAKDEQVAEWYAGYRAIRLQDTPRCFFLPLATIQAALASAEDIDSRR